MRQKQKFTIFWKKEQRISHKNQQRNEPIKLVN